MKSEIKQRIEQIKAGQVPDGYKKTKIGVVPKEWEEVRFKKMFSRLSRKNCENNDNVLTISAQYGLISQSEFFNKNIASEDKSNYFLLHKGEYAYNKSYSNGYPYGALKKLERYEKGIVSPLYICFSPTSDNKCAEYYSHYFESNLIGKEIKAIAQEGARNHGLLNISVNDFFNMYILNPPLAEQEKIVKILSTQDRIIELYQRKIEELQKLKKIYLSKMFPQKGKSIPEWRFPQFTDDWEQREFNSEFIMLQNNTLSRAELTADKGDAMNVHYGDILVKFGEVLDIETEELPYIESEQIVSKFKSSLLQEGDIIVADTAEDETVGKCTEMANIKGFSVLSGLHTIPLRPLKKFASGYLGYYLNSSSYHDSLIPLMQGTKVTSISKSALQGTYICYPDEYEEQQKIGIIFRKLDNLITLHQRKLEENKKYKNALMQLLLTGIVRCK